MELERVARTRVLGPGLAQEAILEKAKMQGGKTLGTPSVFWSLIASVALVFFVSPAIGGTGADLSAQDTAQKPSPSATLTNKGILDMVKGGLAEEIILAKIQTSPCDFDTSPAALTEIKAAGVPDAVILAMVTAGSPGTKGVGPPQTLPQNSPTTQALANHTGPALGPPKGFKISYVKSDRKWKHGFQSKPYDQISDYLLSHLVDDLNVKGVKTVSDVERGCCLVSVELLQASNHAAWIKKAGIELSVTVTVTDAESKLIYSKGYRQESKALAGTWGRFMNQACEALAKNIAEDEHLVRVLTTGKL